jgi:hypothetical protein
MGNSVAVQWAINSSKGTTMNRFSSLCLCLVGISLCSNLVLGQSQESTVTKEVVATGVGETAALALKAAQQAAVEQAVGLLVDAETIVQNDALITDQILTASNGFIERYQILTTKKDGALTKVRIQAVVRSGKLAERLAAITKTRVSIDGKDLLAEIQTKGKSQKDQQRMLSESLMALTQGVLSVRVIGKPQKVENIDLAEGLVRVRVPLEISVDLKAYEDRLKRLMPQLAEFARVKRSTPLRMIIQDPVMGEFLSQNYQLPNWLNLRVKGLDDLDSKQAFPPSGMFAGYKWLAVDDCCYVPEAKRAPYELLYQTQYAWRGFYFIDKAQKEAKEELTAVLVLHGMQASGAYECSVYGLPSSILKDALKSYNGIVRLDVKGLGKSGDEIIKTSLQLETGGEKKAQWSGAWSESNFGESTLLAGEAHCKIESFSRKDGSSDPEFMMQTLVLVPGLATFRWWSYQANFLVTSWRGNAYLDLQEADVARISSIECELSVPASGQHTND